VAAFGRPSHLHKGRDGNRSIADGESATHKNGRLEGTRTQNASASVTQILDAALKFLRRLTRGKSREQTSGVHIKNLRETLMLAAFAVGKGHDPDIVPEDPALVKSSIELTQSG